MKKLLFAFALFLQSALLSVSPQTIRRLNFHILMKNNVAARAMLDNLNDAEIKTQFGGGNNTFLHTAAKGNNTEVAQYLINRGVDCNVQNNRGYTPLFIALKYRNHNTANFFMEKTSITIPNNSGIRPLEWAKQNLPDWYKQWSYLEPKKGPKIR